MTDFASALLLSLVERAASGRGAASAAPPLDARGSFDGKRALLQRLYAERGPSAVLAIGDQVRAYGPHPTLDVLLRARSLPDLVARWQRIERFVHSHHRLEVVNAGRDAMGVEHVSLDGRAPAAAEDLLIAGVVVALAERVGITDVVAAVGTESSEPLARYARGRWEVRADHAVAASTARWTFGWRAPSPAESDPAVDGDPVADDGDELVERLLRLVMDDCCRTWQLDELAAAARLSTRTLQRRLAEAGTSFSALVRTAQVRLAGRLLLDGGTPVALVGLTAGFSDQAHFTREFKRRVGIPPAKYRELFSTTADSAVRADA